MIIGLLKAIEPDKNMKILDKDDVGAVLSMSTEELEALKRTVSSMSLDVAQSKMVLLRNEPAAKLPITFI